MAKKLGFYGSPGPSIGGDCLLARMAGELDHIRYALGLNHWATIADVLSAIDKLKSDKKHDQDLRGKAD